MSYEYTIVTSHSNNLNKSFDSVGKKTSNAYLVTGNYEVKKVNNIEELLNSLKTLTPKQAIIPSVPRNNTTVGMITSRSNQTDTSITRTKKDFNFNGKHILCFDYDPDKRGYTITSPEHYISVLRDIDPSLINCEMGVTYGSSYGIMKDGTLLNDKLSLHCYILIENSTNENVEKYKQYLMNEATKKGYSHIKISKAGSLLKRSVFDDAVFSQERLFFESYPTLANGITQEKPTDYIVGNGARDLNNISVNDNKSEIIFNKLKLESEPEAKIIKDEYIETKAVELMNKQALTKEVAINTIKTLVENKELLSDYILQTKDGIVTVQDIFFNTGKYNEVSVLDPTNPQDGEYVAIIYCNDNGIVVHSFKHGGTNYKLLPNEFIIKELCKQVISQDDDKNLKFVNKIIQYCNSISMSNGKRKEFAKILKSKKIIKKINELQSNKLIVDFPDIIETETDIKILNTIDNLQKFLEYKNIDVSYDEILKEPTIIIPNMKEDTDDKINSQFATIKSEGIKIGLPEKSTDSYLPTIIDASSYNPLMEMVKSKPWDGIDRISKVSNCLISDDDKNYKNEVTKRWLIQCVASWDYIKDCPIDGVLARFENVLTLVGKQGLSKTKYFEMLLPKLHRKYMISGISLDTHDKDSVKLSICSGICELGELDSTFKKDIGSLKAFLSKPVDKMRLPYAKAEISFKRRTSFCASVNDTEFLVDPTGNRRFQPINLKSINYNEYTKIDKQQLWSQVYQEYLDGKRWWIDANIDIELYQQLNKKHTEHEILTPEDDIVKIVIQNTLDPQKSSLPHIPLGSLQYKSPTEICNFYKLNNTRRGVLSKMKKAFISAGIEQKSNCFYVRLQ